MRDSEIAQVCPTLCNPMDYSLPGSSVHEIFPGKNTGLGCHFLLHYINPAIKWYSLEFNQLRRLHCLKKNKVSFLIDLASNLHTVQWSLPLIWDFSTFLLARYDETPYLLNITSHLATWGSGEEQSHLAQASVFVFVFVFCKEWSTILN